MAGTAAAFANDLLLLIFNATAIANVADNASSSPITNIYASLHTASPAAGNQTTNEAAYTSYARVAVARTAGGWDVAANVVTPVADIEFPQASGGSETETHAGLGQLSSGAGLLFFYGAITPNIPVSNGVTPILTTASALTLT